MLCTSVLCTQGPAPDPHKASSYSLFLAAHILELLSCNIRVELECCCCATSRLHSN